MSLRQGLSPPLSCEPTAYTSQDGWKWLCPGRASKPSRAAVCMRVGRRVFMLKVTAWTLRLLPTGTSGAESPDSLFTAALMAAAAVAGPLARPDKLEAPPSELAASDAVALHFKQAGHAPPRSINRVFFSKVLFHMCCTESAWAQSNNETATNLDRCSLLQRAMACTGIGLEGPARNGQGSMQVLTIRRHLICQRLHQRIEDLLCGAGTHE